MLSVLLSKEINILIKTKTEKEKAFLQENRSFIERFCNPNELVIDTEVKIPEEVKSAVISGAEVYIPLAGLVDIEQEIERLEQEKEKWQEEINRVDKKLANKKFVENAPDKIVEAEKEKGRDYKEKFDAVAKQIDKLKNVKEG